MSDEIYKDIEEFKDFYQISESGTVISKRTGKEMKTYLSSSGYKYVVLSAEGKQHERLIHRLLALAFISNPDGLPRVLHVNGDKTDNRLSNLAWTSKRSHYGRCRNTQRKHVRVKRCDTNEIFNSVSAAARSVSGTQAGLTYALEEGRLYKGIEFIRCQ